MSDDSKPLRGLRARLILMQATWSDSVSPEDLGALAVLAQMVMQRAAEERAPAPPARQRRRRRTAPLPEVEVDLNDL